MFDRLKEKLKSWFKKTEKKAEEEEKKEVEEAVKEISKKIKDEKKGERKEKEEKPAEKEERGEEKVEEEREEKSIFQKIKSKFKFKISEGYFDEIFSELETLLLENNTALEIVEFLKKNLKQELVGVEVKKEKVDEEIKRALKISIESLIEKPFSLTEKIKHAEKPFVIVFFGINGSGKTTTIAKVAYLLKKNNISCILAASDTFRAASIEQLEKHGEKLGIKVIKNSYGADPASVAFDAIKHAKAHNIQAVLIDTAGRMHTKENLLKEMEKIIRISKPDLKIFIAESITGNDATQQAKNFNNAVGIDAIILTKADVDEKGGTSLSVSYITGKPILFLGTGQKYSDLEVFDKEKILKQLGLD
ncbi:MAG: signal recognition particle-docking protein FtsY [Nanoarchaeota archaeon]